MSKNKKDTRIGELRKNNQGLTMQIVKYVNNKDILIEFVETGEQRKTTYYNFSKGTPSANLLKYPARNECSFTQAVILTIGISLLTLTALGGLIYWLCK